MAQRTQRKKVHKVAQREYEGTQRGFYAEVRRESRYTKENKPQSHKGHKGRGFTGFRNKNY